MTATATQLIGAHLASVLDDVHIAADLSEARVGDRTVEVTEPRDLASGLAMLLYEQIHSGRPEHDGPRPRTLRDGRLEELLAAATPHETTTVVARKVGESPDGELLVLLVDGVRVAVPASARLTGDERERGDEVVVRLGAVRPALSPGFFLADGSRGRPSGRPLLRVYVHIEGVDHAPAVWAAVLGRLEQEGVPYRAKVSSSPLLYPRHDALVVYLAPGTWHAAGAVVAATRGLAGVGMRTSPFTHRLGAGVGAAWEPADDRPGRTGMSFGEHRALAVAEGLVAHAEAPDGRDRTASVAEALTAANIDPLCPARNIDSPELSAFTPYSEHGGV
ncbi:T3SS effector HopA1 family protein [Streptomyces cyaneus]|uniref:T3SS effector HopA1 family protein n=1 Tax=Streptomyces cyaneus TaxID=1904 RepID=UPI000FF89757|nr:T3SS effector HopA1 family protein [Streptomyces cyaneus]